ncbi:MAG TPA: isoamylase early set domain-containing protein [Thermoanaerobaculia bacterium]|nr:isoamylase early set domain-containing protein [Thermoanaerobaculia bacterium]
MITKTYSKTGSSCRVTFKIPAEKATAQAAAVLGEFNGWNADATPMEKRKDGSFSATVTVPAGRGYRFRYLLDGAKWTNDDAPDASVPNQYGGEDSVLSLEDGAAAAHATPATPATPAKKAEKIEKTEKREKKGQKTAKPAPAVAKAPVKPGRAAAKAGAKEAPRSAKPGAAASKSAPKSAPKEH